MNSIRLLFCLVLVVSVHDIHAAELWREVAIPTRAAEPRKNLLADVYALDSLTPKPVILIQTPYNKAFYRISLSSVLTTSGASVPYDSSKYHYVIVDWRGFYANKSAAITPYDRGQDGYDIVEWIATQPWCNGKVGTWGGSALGMIQFQTAALHPPHLVCAAPFIKDFKTKYEDYYYGGDFRREHVESLVGLGFMASVDNILAHPDQDVTWTLIENQSDMADKIAVPMFLCSGWFDHFPDDVLRAFDDLQLKSAATVREHHKLLFGPWTHSGIGVVKQGILDFPEAAGIPTTMGMAFFDYYLRGEANGWDAQPHVRFFQMGDNVWNTTASWSARPVQYDTLFFHESHRMDATPPGFEKRLSPPDTVVSNPRKPVPTIGGSRFNPFDKTIATGPQDLTSLTTRPDVWYYVSDTLTNSVVIRGESTLQLNLMCTTADADISARLCDVAPDGRWIILTQGIQRLRFRNGLNKEELMPLNTNQAVEIHIQNLAHAFKPGHRVGLVMSSSNYPMFDLNINDGKTMYTKGDTTEAILWISHARPFYSQFVYATEPHTTEVNDNDRDGTHDEAGNANVELYPNPASSSVLVRSQLPQSGSLELEVATLLGQPVRTVQLHVNSDGRAEGLLFIDDLPEGTYVIHSRADVAHSARVLHIIR